MKIIPKSRLIMLLCIIASSFNSCKKGGDPVVFSISLYATNVEISAATRMFTRDGEIKDAQKIAKFIDKVNYFKSEQDLAALGSLYATFSSEGRGTFGASDAEFTVNKNDDQFVFTSDMQSISTAPLYDGFINHLFKYRNVVTNASASAITSREVRVGYGSFNEMKFPVIAYCNSRGNGTNEMFSYYKSSAMANNEFDETAPSYLFANDTLAVKIYTIICRKK